MKSLKLLFILSSFIFITASCSMFRPKYGCGSDGKNVGAEKVLDGSKIKKGKKFKA